MYSISSHPILAWQSKTVGQGIHVLVSTLARKETSLVCLTPTFLLEDFEFMVVCVDNLRECIN